MPQKLIFDGPGSLAMKVQSGLITIKLISISKLPKAIKPDTQERGLRENLSKSEGKSIYNPTARIKFQKLQILHFSHFSAVHFIG